MRQIIARIAFFLSIVLLSISLGAAEEVVFEQIDEFSISEANQGVGVDEEHFYAVDNRIIAKYTKHGELVDTWEGPEDGPIIHLDSAVVVEDGKLYASHSNWRFLPMTSSVEVWDAQTMEHIDSHSIGISLGSLTWLDKHDGYWWGTFANYDREANLPDGTPAGVPYAMQPTGNINTVMVKFDENWQVLESWVFPLELLEKFDVMSNSGGSWGPDGYLYLTGHDLPEIYKVRLPEAGSMLEVVETIPLNIRGQGIAWDRSEPGILYGIIRATDEEEAEGISNSVVVFESNL